MTAIGHDGRCKAKLSQSPLPRRKGAGLHQAQAGHILPSPPQDLDLVHMFKALRGLLGQGDHHIDLGAGRKGAGAAEHLAAGHILGR